MKLIIDIPDDVYEKIIEQYECFEELRTRPNLYEAIAKGAPYEERPKGEWVECSGQIRQFKCSNCGHTIFCKKEELLHYKGCYCGADMRGSANEP